MGKRGNRRRHQQQATKEAVDEAADDAIKKAADEQQTKRQKQAAKEHSDINNGLTHSGLHVSYQGVNDEDVKDKNKFTIPEPFDLKSDSQNLDEANLSKIWRYLGSDKIDEQKEWLPSIIQRQTWSILLQKIPLVGIAPTGSGKTFAYGIPTLLFGATSNSSVLVLVPTRELVQQVSKVCTIISKALQKTIITSGTASRIRVVSVYGGVSRDEQKEELERQREAESLVVVATPGRLLDLAEASETTLASIKSPSWIILDEADQLAKEGDLGPQVDRILNLVRSENKTTLALFSATNPEKVQERFKEWFGGPHIAVKVDSFDNKVTVNDDISDYVGVASIARPPSNDSYGRIPPNLEQILHVCSEHKKPKKLLNTLQTIRKEHDGRNQQLGIIFFGRIEKLKFVSKMLVKENIKCIELHSQLPNHVREKHLKLFSTGQVPLVLATDLAARGIHVNHVRFVIHYDFPGNLESYIHRCGRAGRSGEPAKVYGFFTRNLQPMAADLVKLLEANHAKVDPNLLELVGQQPNDNKGNKKRGKSKRDNVEAVKAVKEAGPKDEVEDEPSDGDEFKDLSPKRIVLKRASHVSDASDDSDIDDNNDIK
jgi:ATP-dependent RNA helicase DDX5/DBP2